MPTQITLPDDYVPYEQLVICSNLMIKGTIPISVGGEVPLLVGKGASPQIWLRAPMSTGGKNWVYLIERNQVIWPSILPNPNFVRLVQPDDKSVEVLYASNRVLKVIAFSKQRAVIAELNLLLFGLNIIGDAAGLTVGGNRFVANRFENTHTMIAIAA